MDEQCVNTILVFFFFSPYFFFYYCFYITHTYTSSFCYYIFISIIMPHIFAFPINRYPILLYIKKSSINHVKQCSNTHLKNSADVLCTISIESACTYTVNISLFFFYTGKSGTALNSMHKVYVYNSLFS
jgi:hypothetical protein